MRASDTNPLLGLGFRQIMHSRDLFPQHNFVHTFSDPTKKHPDFVTNSTSKHFNGDRASGAPPIPKISSGRMQIILHSTHLHQKNSHYLRPLAELTGIHFPMGGEVFGSNEQCQIATIFLEKFIWSSNKHKSAVLYIYLLKREKRRDTFACKLSKRRPSGK